MSESISIKENAENKKRIGLPVERGEIVFYEYDNIIQCESENSYTTFFFKDKSKILISKGMYYYEELLPKEQFLKTHSRHIVNISLITKLFKVENAYLVMSDGSNIPIARERKKDVIKALPKF